MHNSPLRYPGGKTKIANFLRDVIEINGLEGCDYYELYAGGAGAAINLLFDGICKKIILNDLDFHIYAFWYSVINESDSFCNLISQVKPNLSNWNKQSKIYANYNDYSLLEVGFATFYLNRTNRSGILFKAGPIGGFDQSGNYKIDARYNKSNLIRRVEKIAKYSDKIKVHNKESISFLRYIAKLKGQKFLFLDPPYYEQGEKLYLNFYRDADHSKLSDVLKKNDNLNWILTYDNCKRINSLYSSFNRMGLKMNYSLQTKITAKEVLIFSDSLKIPQKIKMGKVSRPIYLWKKTA